MRLGCAKQHVAWANQLDLALIGIRARRWAESTNQNEPRLSWALRIGLSFDDMPVENHDLTLLKLFGLTRPGKCQAIRLLPVVVHIVSLRAAGEQRRRVIFAASSGG